VKLTREQVMVAKRMKERGTSVRQRTSSLGPPGPEVAERVGRRPEARLDVPKAVPEGHPGEGHRQILVSDREPPYPSVPIVAPDAPLQPEPGSLLHDLGEGHLPLVHRPLLWVSSPKNADTPVEVQIGAAPASSQNVAL